MKALKEKRRAVETFSITLVIHIHHHEQDVGRNMSIKVASCDVSDQRKTVLLQPEEKVILVKSGKELVFYCFVESGTCR